MNVALAQNLSIYQLALGMQPPPQTLPLSPATLLSLIRAQIDLLIEQQILATLWVKLPPGKIWDSEIQRYNQQIGVSSTIYNCQIEESLGAVEDTGSVEISASSSANHNLFVPTQLDPQIRREYFIIVLSPQFCSLTLAYRPLKRSKIDLWGRLDGNKTAKLQAITTFEGKIIQRVLNKIEHSINSKLSPFIPNSFICPPTPEPTLLTQLLAKQLQRQEEINYQIFTNRIAKIQQQKQKLHRKEQLNDEYLSNVCQELRIPLTHMKTALSLLNSPSLKAPQKQRYLQMLSNQCDRQNSLITGVLELMQSERNLERMNLESVRLADIVPGVVSTYQPLAQEKGVMVAYTVPTELPDVWCVSGGLKQILINLLSNSIKFTRAGGEVWVRGRVHGDYVQLEFCDTGIGIAENEIPQIFNRFYRVRPSAPNDPGGAGLGLTIVQQLLWRSGGSIFVKSKQFEGSTFTIQLPIVHLKNGQ